MSFNACPEEILSRFGELLLAAHSAEDDFYGWELGDSRQTQLIWCLNWRIESLASVNSKMRRILLPMLFSHVIFIESHYERYLVESSRRIYDALCALPELLANRPHIAQQIMCVC
jgi:hypothetical protein